MICATTRCEPLRGPLLLSQGRFRHRPALGEALTQRGARVVSADRQIGLAARSLRESGRTAVRLPQRNWTLPTSPRHAVSSKAPTRAPEPWTTSLTMSSACQRRCGLRRQRQGFVSARFARGPVRTPALLDGGKYGKMLQATPPAALKAMVDRQHPISAEQFARQVARWPGTGQSSLSRRGGGSCGGSTAHRPASGFYLLRLHFGSALATDSAPIGDQCDPCTLPPVRSFPTEHIPREEVQLCTCQACDCPGRLGILPLGGKQPVHGRPLRQIPHADPSVAAVAGL